MLEEIQNHININNKIFPNPCLAKDPQLKQSPTSSFLPSNSSKFLSTTSINILNQNLQNYPSLGILDSKYSLLQKTGKGATAKVYTALPLPNAPLEKKIYSIKIISPDKIDLPMFQAEVFLLQSISHPNVLQIFDYGSGTLIKSNGKQKQVHYIVMENLNHGELLKYITEVSSIPGENKGFGEEFGKIIFSKLLDGLEAIHNADIAHRDIKPDNIMLDENYEIKYVDFGFATKKSGMWLNSYLGTPSYAAPEIHLRKPYLGQFEDIFSLGVTLFVLVTGSLPFKLPVPNDSLYQYFVRNDYYGYWKKRNIKVSESFMELFNNMVAFDFTQRPTISEIRQCRWMKNINWELLPKLKQNLKVRELISKQKKNQNNNQNIQTPMIGLLEAKKVKRDIEVENTNEKISIEKIEIKMDNEEKKYSNKIINSGGDIAKEENNQGMILDDNEEEEKEQENNSKDNIINTCEELKGTYRLKTQEKNLNTILLFIIKYCKAKGYKKCTKSKDELKINISSGKLSISLTVEKCPKDFVKLIFVRDKGTKDDFDKFKKVIMNLKLSI